jgi:antitoxin ParD1/3/4
MNITLDPELERFVQEKIRTGQCRSVEEVIQDALSAMRQQETLTAEDVAELRQEIALGLDQLDRGESAPWNAAVLKDEVQRKLGGY